MKSAHSVHLRGSPRGAAWLVNAAACAAYFATAKLGLAFTTMHGSVSPFWPASGLAIAVIVLGGRRCWPGIYVGAFLANFFTPVAAPVALGIACGNTLEALLGAWLFVRLSRLRLLEPFTEMFAWGMVALVAPLPSVVLGIGTLALAGTGPGASLSSLTLTWWVGDMLGIFVTAPALWAFLGKPGRIRLRVISIFKATCLIAATIIICVWIFHYASGSPTLFLIFPILLLATAWFGKRGALCTSLVLITLSVAATCKSLDPLVSEGFRQTLHQFLPFLFAIAFTAHLLGVFARKRCLFLPSLVLLAGWALAGWLFYTIQSERLKVDQLRVANAIDEIQDAIKQRLTAYTDALHGGASLFEASDYVSRVEWRRYVNSLDLTSRYPGIFGMGVIFPLRERDKEGFLSAIRANENPDLNLHPVPSAKPPSQDPAGWDYYVVTFIEPEEPNAPAIGLDIDSEKNRAEAARVARDYGQPRICAQVTLVQAGQRKRGFLLFVPMYDPKRPHDNVHERRVGLRGWVYAPFVTEDFFHSAVAKTSRILDFRVFDGLDTNPARLIFNSAQNSSSDIMRTTVLQLGGQQFTMGWSRGPAYQKIGGDPFLVAASLALLPALLAGMVMTLQTSERRARELAGDRMRALRKVNEDLEAQMAEREKAETEALHARETAEAANAAKSDFLAMMSHEIRTPMNGVVGYAELLADSHLTSEQQSWAQTIRSSGRMLLDIINDILDFSKIEAGKLSLESIPFDPFTSAREVVSLLEPLAGQKELTLSLEADPNLPAGIVGDPVRFKQILMNLGSNALRFTDHGTVKVRMNWKSGSPKGTLRIEVQDTGPGIAEEKRRLLFQKFSQLDSSTTRRHGGTGLGLAICKRLVELMGGNIEINSALGEGTTIWFEIPFTACGKKELNALDESGGIAAAGLVGQGKHVLLAEDTPVNRRLASTILGKLGCTIDIARDGREAVEKNNLVLYDLIFMDCQMPLLDGFAASREIRAQEHADHRTPIIAVTANALEGDREKCLEAGMDDYISKPYTQKDFVRILLRFRTPDPTPGTLATKHPDSHA